MKTRRFIARHPLAFAVATLVVCLAVYSAVATADTPSPIFPAAAATIPALIAYWLSRPILWAGAARKRDARVLALAAIGAAVVVSALGIALGAFEPHASDIPLIAGQGADFSPVLSLLTIAAVCAFTGIYEEAAFSAVLCGGLRRYYARDDNDTNPEKDTDCPSESRQSNGVATGGNRRNEASAPTPCSPIRSLTRQMLGKAAAVQGVAFALAHIVTALLASAQGATPVMVGQIIVWFAATFLFGVVTAVLMEYGRSLTLNAIVHAVYDFALFGPLALKAGTMRSATITGDATDLALFAAQACLLAVILIALYGIGKRRGAKMDDGNIQWEAP